jgi:hypothetical protein
VSGVLATIETALAFVILFAAVLHPLCKQDARA